LSSFKTVFLTISKWLGLFYLSRRLTRPGVRILCYHAFSTDGDECDFRPKLFMRCSTFQKRLQVLHSAGYPVITLDAALQGLAGGNLPACATVITIDDGFPSVYRCAGEALSRYKYPATVYVTSYYSVKQNPVFRLLVQYLLWKTSATTVAVPESLRPLQGTFSLASKQEKSDAADEIIRVGQEQCSEQQRLSLVQGLARLLEVDLGRILMERVFHVMNREELVAAAAKGLDVQLHTHRHRFPEESGAAAREIRDNRAVLEPIAGKPLRHFCYPSGVWSKNHWPVLAREGIKSATTSAPGLNFPGAAPYGLLRVLDSEDVTQIEFEAEMAGFAELLRRIRRKSRAPSA